jgi:hypothetical protein
MSKTLMPPRAIVAVNGSSSIRSKGMLVMRARLGLLVVGFLAAAGVIVTVVAAVAAPVAVLAGTSWDN